MRQIRNLLIELGDYVGYRLTQPGSVLTYEQVEDVEEKASKLALAADDLMGWRRRGGFWPVQS